MRVSYITFLLMKKISKSLAPLKELVSPIDGGPPTQLWEHDEVLCAALRARHAGAAVAPLLLVHPALQAWLVHPLGGSTASAGANPLRCAIVLVCGEAHPAAPAADSNSGDVRQTLSKEINKTHRLRDGWGTICISVSDDIRLKINTWVKRCQSGQYFRPIFRLYQYSN